MRSRNFGHAGAVEIDADLDAGFLCLARDGAFMGGFTTSATSGDLSIKDCARELLDALARVNPQGQPPPLDKQNLVFVCHSTGGIVARYLLERHQTSFKEKAIGLVLIASPSLGSVYANKLAALARFYNQHLGLQLQWGGESLTDLDDRFKDLVFQNRLPRLIGVEAYEHYFILRKQWLPTWVERWMPNRRKLVTELSAGRYFGAPRLLPDTDHFSTVKPDSLDHPAHELLVTFWSMFKRFLQGQGIEPKEAHHSVSACCQLRAVPTEFTGRHETLIRLRDNLISQMKQRDAVGVVNIVGSPGVGKTALANALAQSLVEKFPDAQLFIELGRHSAAPRTLDEALGQAIKTLDRKDKKFGTDTRTWYSMYLSKLANKRALIILDDVRDDEQVAMLMPPAGCAAIITSRQHLANFEAHTLAILTQESAVALLQRYRTLQEEEANELVELCGGLPVALTTIGGLLRKYPTRSTQDLITRLQQSGPGIEFSKLEKLFEYSYQDLDVEHQRAWRMLSVIPVPFWRQYGDTVIADSIALPSALDELTARSLLVFDPATERFSWHDLLRKFAQAKLLPLERELATERWKGTLLGQLSEAWALWSRNDDFQNAITIQTPIQAEAQRQQMERWRILQETQTKIFEIQQDVMENKARTQDRMYKKWDEYIRS